MSFTSFDQQMMQIALMLARRGLGVTAPNPSVGAVIADEATGELIARGVTQPGGRPHAETEALRRAGPRARGATLYVTLEPCAHHGKTPPCADAVVAAGLKRVVIGVEDPDVRTRGQGIAKLRAAGIRVETGLCAEDARWATLGHIRRVTEHRPFVQLKMAVDASGDIPRGAAGRAVFVTGPEARQAAHRLRADSDAILIGSGTARDDDPELTCRLPGLAQRSPVRMILSRMLDLPQDLKLFRTAREVPLWMFTGEEAGEDRVQSAEAMGVRVIKVPVRAGALSLTSVLGRLADEGITRLLVEGGEVAWRSFAAERFVDEVALFQAGGGGKGPLSPGALAAHYAPGVDLTLAAHRRVGADALSIFRVVDLPRPDVGRSA
ncbi:bifunctional diaminohydroxyphosphoribosylaminopyrimidine deaminase/5-amino-6-(5-phosphoribosylamino)uracil reductase RibD [Hyphomicrobium sp.]|uniref:bifunctional diaminohydroxyphosphoribosylaminopyrimidine deaminase/5-amino-6-(5-phosphoribosylamino)uracil reductase RibD n=1 Tax=Hyphomicrobium sp. TaxID=82 RepID=UPI002E3597E6|nr:bifunctional diaminohydroxyphosphoribosylaminopyrimidine deaminase/5-amino-6-(5-phosphoribosylamino)uracil reductase RibD [Hyphomicrobium sp.]HEX2842663.1 bifunctional diaminohydroxyphosphoribosylaminopyrimidine deaminase/5-amino-6-(5-phosphoribosylamino)uracil reductase RibD [Hyphomicrobium sp.]